MAYTSTFQSYMPAAESEEERRRRLEQEAAAAAGPTMPTPTVLPPGGDAMAQQPAPVMPEAPAPVEQEQSQTQPNVQMVDGKLKLAPLEISEGVQLACHHVAGVDDL